MCVCSVLLAQLTHIASWYTADASTFILIAITLITWFLFFFGFRDASERDGFIWPSLLSKKVASSSTVTVTWSTQTWSLFFEQD